MEEQKWIFFKNQIPEIGTQVVVVDIYGLYDTGRMGISTFDGRPLIMSNNRPIEIRKLIAWMEIPNPPELNDRMMKTDTFLNLLESLRRL